MNVTDLIAITTGQASPTFTDNEDTVSNETTAQTTSEPSTGEEFTTFLTLLTAQIRNQDPLEPLESTQFVEQLATFSGLELQAKANNVLEDIAAMLAQQLYSGPSNPS